MQKFWDMVLSHFLSFTVVVLEVMIFQNKKSVVLEVGKNHKDCLIFPRIAVDLILIAVVVFGVAKRHSVVNSVIHCNCR